MRMILLRSLTAGMKQLVEKFVSAGELTINQTDQNDPIEQPSVIEPIISIVARDSPVDEVKRMAVLNKHACITVRRNGEKLNTFLESCSLPAQT